MSSSRRKLLLISYLFPPAGGIAVQRALSFAKYLPPLGWDVHVLKAWETAAPVLDPALRAQVPECVRVHEAFTPEIPFALRQKLWALMNGSGKAVSSSTPVADTRSRPSLPARIARRILCPEPEIAWVPFALRKATKIVERFNIDTVIVTVPPFSALLVGAGLKRRFPQIELVSDFRDEWLTFYLKDFEFQSGHHTRPRAEQIEREAVEASDLVVAVTPSSLQEVRKRYPEQPDAKFACIYNGYDPEVFRDFKPRPHSLPGKIVVTHMGTVYKTATPKYYLDALDALPEEIRSRFETRFIGRIAESEKALFEGRKSNIRLLGFMPQAEALRWVEETDYLLLTMTDPISLPGKLFEYLATGKPIIAISPIDGEVGKLLRPMTDAIDPQDHAELTQFLAHAAQSGPPSTTSAQSISRFARPELVFAYHSQLTGGVAATVAR